jgi:hypothetical protein
LGVAGLALSSPEWLKTLSPKAKLLVYASIPTLGTIGGMGIGALARPDTDAYLKKYSKKYNDVLESRYKNLPV